MSRKWVLILVVVTLALTPMTVGAAQVFAEGFGNAAPAGTAISTSNTNLSYVRVGSGGGSIQSSNSTLGGGVNNSISMTLGGSMTGSLNGVGKSGLTAMTVTTMNFRMKITSGNTGTFFIGMGTGNTFTSGITFVNADLMWAIQSKDHILQYRNSSASWVNTGTTLVVGTEYHFHIVANGSTSALTDYNGAEDLAAGRMDLYLDGTLIGDDLTIPDNQDATAFRIYQIDGGTFAEFDNIYIDNAALGPFTPTAITLASLAASTATVPTPLAALPVLGLVALGGLAAVAALGIGAVLVKRRR